jgi:hypothetical protein
MDVQRKRVSIIDGNRPFDHDADRGAGRQIVSGCHQHATAADIHRPALALYLLPNMNVVTGAKLDGEASLPATFRSIEGIQILHRESLASGAKINLARAQRQESPAR